MTSKLKLLIALPFLFASTAFADECYELYSAEQYKQALVACTKQAEQGDKYAQYNLGVTYESGLGVLQDYKQAYALYNIAASQGYKVATKNRDDIAEKMTPSQIQEAQKLSRKWKPTKNGSSNR